MLLTIELLLVDNAVDPSESGVTTYTEPIANFKAPNAAYARSTLNVQATCDLINEPCVQILQEGWNLTSNYETCNS